ncbi:hypothetical protein NDU88_002064 [Pleurodeles waltl]|uniref:Uncharacterized protein n=1 Tax=Pleurodeles waltl TaxID=8319 RepID=A0AAV7P7Q0_PLEWA|nr:hypothetical protein NDU88_002064 [Pleurodeles waltl]
MSTNASPFELMRGRTPMSKENVGWLKVAKRVELSPEEVKKNIERAQDKYKRYFDDVHKSKEIKLCVGDVARVKTSKHTGKCQSRFLSPLRVEAVYNNSVKLSDGKIRHLAVLSLCKRTSVNTRKGGVRDGQNCKEWLEDERNEEECLNQGERSEQECLNQHKNVPSGPSNADDLPASTSSYNACGSQGVLSRNEKWSSSGRRIIKPKRLEDYYS